MCGRLGAGAVLAKSVLTPYSYIENSWIRLWYFTQYHRAILPRRVKYTVSCSQNRTQIFDMRTKRMRRLSSMLLSGHY